MSGERKATLEYIFEGLDGYLRLLCIDRTKKPKQVQEKFFEYPDDLDAALAWMDRRAVHNDIYFCPHLFTEPKARKELASVAPAVWADLDGLPVDELKVEPSLVVESSPGKHHVYWKLDPYAPPFDVEAINKRIAYFHAENGADTSGWDLTQLLRVPGTYNHKYGVPQAVKIVRVNRGVRYELDEFGEYPALEDAPISEDSSIPHNRLPRVSAHDLLDQYKVNISPLAFRAFRKIPGDGEWSDALWTLECTLFEAGLSPEEVFVIARDSKCNKYKRDGRPETDLWKDVVKAHNHVRNKEESEIKKLTLPSDGITPLLSEEEREKAAKADCIIRDYIDWAKTLGDAAPQYHQAGAFTILSAMMAGRVTLPTSFGTILPNLWFMILADTTLTRKTTAMDIAMDMILDVDPDAVLATDGSIEGLMSSLSTRPGRPSIFLRDEITGLVDAMTRKEYLSGMLEAFTKLYDGKYQKRILKKETIEVRDPVLIFFAGGIKSRMQEILTDQHVVSGFLPRFVIITAEVDLTRIKPLGPPTEESTDERDNLVERFRKVREHYLTDRSHNEGNRVRLTPGWKARLTPDAWAKYNEYEMLMREDAIESQLPDLMKPVMDRLAKSGLKAAVLMAAANRLEDYIQVEEEDVIRAFYYVEQWRSHTIHIVNTIGMSQNEKLLMAVYKFVRTHAGGKSKRSDIMRMFRLTARDADGIFATLEQRGLLASKKGKGGAQFFYSAVE